MADYFDWDVRTDRYGKPVGYFATTPYPVNESSTSFNLTNDEGTTTYSLGTLYFVDGAIGVSGDGLSLAGAIKTIASAISVAGSGNKSILVRGPHDAFDGIYNEYGLSLGTGTDNTHRFSLIGYEQERPIIDGIDSTTSSYLVSMANYSTVQRFKLQEHYYMALRPAQRTKPSLIDVWCYNTTKGSGIDGGGAGGDGHVYAASADGFFVHHCLMEHSYGHAIKYSDACKNTLTEWTKVMEFGYWTGLEASGGGHPSGFDYPDCGVNHILRYCVADTGLFYAVQVRGNAGYDPDGIGKVDIHHCEIISTTHFDDVTGESGHVSPCNVLLYTALTGSSVSNVVYFRNNIVRDGSDAGCYGIYVTDDHNTDITYIFNNLIYNNNGSQIRVADSSASVVIYNNSFYSSNTAAIINSGSGTDVDIINNIFYQNGTGDCLSIGTGTHTHNRYYFPSGGRGVVLGTGEADGDPDWVANPSGAYSSNECSLNASITGTSLAGFYTVDFLDNTRSTWDMGAKEYYTGGGGGTTTGMILWFRSS